MYENETPWAAKARRKREADRMPVLTPAEATGAAVRISERLRILVDALGRQDFDERWGADVQGAWLDARITIKGAVVPRPVKKAKED